MQNLTLLYHELRPDPSAYSYVTECARFRAHLVLYQKLRMDPTIPRPEITFDDGHRSNFEYALPMLEEQSMVARFFITVGWTATRSSFMGWDELRALHTAGQRIGAHGWTHTLLTHLRPAALDRELRGSRETLEDRLATPITTMSLPGGRFNRRVLDACAEAGYAEVWTSIPRAETLPLGSLSGRLNIRGEVTDDWLEELFRPESVVLRGLERQQRRKDLAKALLGDRVYAMIWATFNKQEASDEHLQEASDILADR